MIAVGYFAFNNSPHRKQTVCWGGYRLRQPVSASLHCLRRRCAGLRSYIRKTVTSDTSIFDFKERRE